MLNVRTIKVAVFVISRNEREVRFGLFGEQEFAPFLRMISR